MKKLFFALLFLLLSKVSFSKDRMIIQASVSGVKRLSAYISRTDSAFVEIDLGKGNSNHDATYFLLWVKKFENDGWKVVDINIYSFADGWPSYIYTLEK